MFNSQVYLQGQTGLTTAFVKTLSIALVNLGDLTEHAVNTICWHLEPQN